MSAEEIIAIRQPKRGKAHRIGYFTAGGFYTGCEKFGRSMTERVPLSQTAPGERCRTCWPTTKETR